MTGQDPRPINWLKTVIVIVATIVLCILYVLFDLFGSEFSFPALRGSLARLILNVIPSVIAAGAIIICVYFVLERRGLSSGQQLSEEIASRVEQKLEESAQAGLLDVSPTYQLCNRCVVIINGSSGVGKSTVAASLARRLGIGSVLVTDFVREAMRFVLPESDVRYRILFASSYEAHQYLEDAERSGNCEADVAKGFDRQCKAMVGAIDHIIDRVRGKREPVVIEGVNLVTTQLLQNLPADVANIVIINLYIRSEETHLERLRRRSEKCRQTPQQSDKYIRNIKQIRIIDEYLHNDAESVRKQQSHVISLENSGTVFDTVRRIMKHLRKLNMLQRTSAQGGDEWLDDEVL